MFPPVLCLRVITNWRLRASPAVKLRTSPTTISESADSSRLYHLGATSLSASASPLRLGPYQHHAPWTGRRALSTASASKSQPGGRPCFTPPHTDFILILHWKRKLVPDRSPIGNSRILCVTSSQFAPVLVGADMTATTFNTFARAAKQCAKPVIPVTLLLTAATILLTAADQGISLSYSKLPL